MPCQQCYDPSQMSCPGIAPPLCPSFGSSRGLPPVPLCIHTPPLPLRERILFLRPYAVALQQCEWSSFAFLLTLNEALPGKMWVHAWGARHNVQRCAGRGCIVQSLQWKWMEVTGRTVRVFGGPSGEGGSVSKQGYTRLGTKALEKMCLSVHSNSGEVATRMLGGTPLGEMGQWLVKMEEKGRKEMQRAGGRDGAAASTAACSSATHVALRWARGPGKAAAAQRRAGQGPRPAYSQALTG